MYNITLISTRHDNIGECNAHALCQILEHLKPEVIFEEIPPSYFDRFYIEKTRTNLEVEAISAYLLNHNVQHIPVDIDDIPNEAFFRDYQHAVERVLGLIDQNGFNYRCLVDASKRHAANYGFNYLNSNQYNTYIEELRDAFEAGLEKINDDTLSLAYRSWNELSDRRENEMLQNIYNFSRNHTYNNAVFLLGAGHRKSIINKIQYWEGEDELKLNWSIHNG
jgi:hypothetical protein